MNTAHPTRSDVTGLPAAGATLPGRRWPRRIALPGLRLHASERRLLLGVVDLAILFAALATAVKSRTTWLDPPGALLANWRWFLTLSLVWWLVSQLLDVYDLSLAASPAPAMISAGSAAGLTVLIYQWIPLFSPPLASRGLVLFFALLALGGMALWRGLYATLFVQPFFHRRALVLGAGWAGQALAEALRDVPSSGNPYYGGGYQLVGFVDDDPTKQAGQLAGLPVLGTSRDLPRLARELQVDEVVLAITHRHAMSQEAFDALLACREQGAGLTTMPALYEGLLGRVPVEHLGRDLSAILRNKDTATERLYSMMKRIADLVFSAAGLIVTALLVPFIWLANALFSRGPLFYRQVRVGRNGRPFTIVKFRTMRPDAEQATGAVWTAPDDPRVTAVGRVLRRTRLDELPQFYNVLRGEMSLIGPRPERPEFVDTLAAQIPFYRARHVVRPGVTGWAQVRFRYGSCAGDARIKLEYDLYYVRHAGFYLDALIVLKTAAMMVRLRGR